MKFVKLLALVAGALLLCVPRAFALSGPVALPFASAYTAPDGSTCTHRGIDVVVAAGESVTSPAEGTVTFAGRIPGPHGGSVLAVTIASGDSKITLLPLDGLTVAKGETVAQGDHLGACAESGDPSTASPHVHLSQRSGDVYLDPIGLLAAAAVQAQAQAQSEPAEAPVPEPGVESPQPSSATLAEGGAGTTAPAMGGGSVPSASAASVAKAALGAANTAAGAAAVAAAGASSVAADVVSGVALAAGELEPGVSLVPAADAPAATVVHATPAGASPVAMAARAATKAAAPAVRFAAGHLPLSLAVLAAVVFGSALLISRRALTRKYA
ncbi:MAG TPA: M23 family metallopeptidase, partial [Coriobacteriia bacterium]|nr:M23 family metallopeptidase [Coriobacteriia bacterium]